MLTTATNLSTRTHLKMSYEEFLAWSDEDTHAEWNNNEVIIQMPAKLVHQQIVDFLNKLLGFYADLFQLGKVITAPFEVKLTFTGAAREPDVFFIATKNLPRLTEDRLQGPPDLVIEVISTSSVKIDRDDKFKEYQAAGAREYWIIDPRPQKQRADFYRLTEKGVYQLYATEEDEQVASQVLTGFWLRPAWLWQADVLNPLTCSFEIAGVIEAVKQQMQKVAPSI
jgi:Uma2 family endonuclease